MKKDKPVKISAYAKKKMELVMDEFKKGNLHTGSKTGPIVKNKMQAVAIGLALGKRNPKK